jgi:hypothetical protein
MSLNSSFVDKWIEFDYNPMVFFSSAGKVLSLNEDAQYLLAKVSSKTIFDLAVSYASNSFGFNTVFMDLEFDRFNFFGLTVGYENEDIIGIKLYKYPPLRLKNIDSENTQKSNIYSLIDLAISTNAIKTDAKFVKEFDPTLPEIKLDTTNFIKTLDRIYKLFLNSENIITKLYLKIGEFIKHDDKKYKLFIIEIQGNKKGDIDPDIKKLAVKINAITNIKRDRVILELPLIID